MIEAWIVTRYYEDFNSDQIILHEEPDDYYYKDPDYKVEHICYSILNKVGE